MGLPVLSALVAFLRNVTFLGQTFHVFFLLAGRLGLVSVDIVYHLLCLAFNLPVSLACVLTAFGRVSEKTVFQIFHIAGSIGGAVLLAYTLTFASNEMEKTMGLLTVHLCVSSACMASLYNAVATGGRPRPLLSKAAAFECWPLVLTTIVGFGSLPLCAEDATSGVVTLLIFIVMTVMIFGAVLDTCVIYLEELQMEREYNEHLLEAMFATARLRGCPSIFSSRSDLDLMSANNPVVVKSSAKLDELFGRQMLGGSLNKAYVVHHAGRQQLKSLFCKDSIKREGDLIVTFMDAAGNEFDCAVAVPPQKASEQEKASGRELLVGFRLVGEKKPPFGSRRASKVNDKYLRTRSSPSSPTTARDVWQEHSRAAPEDDRFFRRRTPIQSSPPSAQNGTKRKKRVVDVQAVNIRATSDSPRRKFPPMRSQPPPLGQKIAELDHGAQPLHDSDEDHPRFGSTESEMVDNCI